MIVWRLSLKSRKFRRPGEIKFKLRMVLKTAFNLELPFLLRRAYEWLYALNIYTIDTVPEQARLL